MSVRAAVAFTILLSAAAFTRAATYRISPTGAAGRRTVADANALALAAGDSVLFEGGVTFTGAITVNASGLSGLPIVYGSYGAGRATISSGSSNGLTCANREHVRIERLNFIGNGYNANSATGIMLSSTSGYRSGIAIDSVEISQYGNRGIQLRGAAGAGLRDTRITNAVVHHIRDSGIETGPWSETNETTRFHQNLYFGRCKVYNTYGNTSIKASGLMIGRVNRALIEYCEFYNTGIGSNVAGGGPVGTWSLDSDSITWQFCISHNNQSDGVDGGGFDIDGGCRYCTIQYCYAYGNKASGYFFANWTSSRVWSNNTVRYCISENDARQTGGINIWGNCNGPAYVYGNTVFGDGSAGTKAIFRIESSGSQVKVWNNIFYSRNNCPLINSSPGASSMPQFRGNLYYAPGTTAEPFRIIVAGTTYGSLAAWQQATQQEMIGGVSVGLETDPLLENPGHGGALTDPERLPALLTAYRLRAGSPAINAGLDIGALFSVPPGPHDFYGTPVPQGPRLDMGAHEYEAATGMAPERLLRLCRPSPLNAIAALSPVHWTLDGRARAGLAGDMSRGACAILAAPGTGPLAVATVHGRR